jgi:hypothetical protein
MVRSCNLTVDMIGCPKSFTLLKAQFGALLVDRQEYVPKRGKEAEKQ